MVIAIIGSQWGDEGKGRVCHFETPYADMVIRCTGGNNAGHTVVSEGKKYALHLLPSSIICPDKLSVIGAGTVIDPKELLKEITELRERGVKITPMNLVISDRAQVTLPVHIELDGLQEEFRGDAKIGTTKRGIGPTYEDKHARFGIRMCDLIGSPEALWRKIQSIYDRHETFLYNAWHPATGHFSGKWNLFQQEQAKQVNMAHKKCLAYGKKLREFIKDTTVLTRDALSEEKCIVMEGAQSTYLDVDWGTYPDVTSSNPIASGACTGSGIGPTYINEVIGIMKAYTSRVGEGPFPTEQDNEIGNRIRELGHEYGTTTGRPRRCGWLDLVMIKHAAYINGFTSLAVNHVDTIGKFDEFQVCIGYQYKGKIIDYVPVDIQNCEPIYKTFKGGWNAEGAKSLAELGENAEKFIDFIERYTKRPVVYIGIGPDAEQTIVR